MLSRVADSIYWMSRYIERAENVARFVDVNLNLMLDSPTTDQQWEPLVNITGDHLDFTERYGKEALPQNVIHFLTFDRENPNSIISCLRCARENARSVREIISSEMWLQLNTFYLMVNSAAACETGLASPHSFFNEVKQASHLFTGITDATMTQGEAWHFCRLGRKLERADKTSRILDVKYFILLGSVSEVGTLYDDVQWIAVLRSDASHAWVSFFCPGQGWVDVDPTNNLPVGGRHITTAGGRDYSDVSPVRGIIIGTGEHSLSVSMIKVTLAGAQDQSRGLRRYDDFRLHPPASQFVPADLFVLIALGV